MSMKSRFLLAISTLLVSCVEAPTSTVKQSGATVAIDTNPKYELIWSDEFDGEVFNEDYWSLEEGYVANDELQDYQKSGNHYLSNGTLKIVAKKLNDDKKFGSYTSARLNSYGKQGFTYGRIEARMKLPTGVGTWPAFWMLGNSIMEGTRWPTCGEIDIMEYVGFDPNIIWGSIHSKANNHIDGTQKTGSITIEGEDRWHTYGILWEESGIKFYFETPENVYYEVVAPEIKTAENWPFDEPHFLLLNLAVGGMWGGLKGVDNTIFDTTMEVDYVRVYRIKK